MSTTSTSGFVDHFKTLNVPYHSMHILPHNIRISGSSLSSLFLSSPRCHVSKTNQTQSPFSISLPLPTHTSSPLTGDNGAVQSGYGSLKKSLSARKRLQELAFLFIYHIHYLDTTSKKYKRNNTKHQK